MNDHTKLDLLPNIEHVIKMAELHNKNLKFDRTHWNLDQKADFYLGMFAAMRVFQSGVVKLQDDYATSESEKERLGKLEMECIRMTGEIANIIMDKYDLKGFTV
jgi:hypothetical protein